VQNKIIKKRANVLFAEDAPKTNDTINYLNLLECAQITKIHLLNKRYSKLNLINVNIYYLEIYPFTTGATTIGVIVAASIRYNVICETSCIMIDRVFQYEFVEMNAVYQYMKLT